MGKNWDNLLKISLIRIKFYFSYGYKGLECLLRAICEANALQFMRHYDVYGELLHIFFRYLHIYILKLVGIKLLKSNL